MILCLVQPPDKLPDPQAVADELIKRLGLDVTITAIQLRRIIIHGRAIGVKGKPLAKLMALKQGLESAMTEELPDICEQLEFIVAHFGLNATNCKAGAEDFLVRRLFKAA